MCKSCIKDVHTQVEPRELCKTESVAGCNKNSCCVAHFSSDLSQCKTRLVLSRHKYSTRVVLLKANIDHQISRTQLLVPQVLLRSIIPYNSCYHHVDKRCKEYTIHRQYGLSSLCISVAAAYCEVSLHEHKLDIGTWATIGARR